MRKILLFIFLSFLFWACREKEEPSAIVIVDHGPPVHHYTTLFYRNAAFKPGKNAWIGLDSGSATIFRFIHFYDTPKLHDSGGSCYLLFSFKNQVPQINRDYFFQDSNETEAYSFLMASMGGTQKLNALRGCFRVVKYSADTLVIQIRGKAEGDWMISNNNKTEIIAEDTTLVFTGWKK